jgi:hypothetical protein
VTVPLPQSQGVVLLHGIAGRSLFLKSWSAPWNDRSSRRSVVAAFALALVACGFLFDIGQILVVDDALRA